MHRKQNESNSTESYVLSQQKKSFLENKQFTPIIMEIADARVIAKHYLDKSGIKIIVSGDTQFARTYMAEKRINNLGDDSKKYAQFMLDNYGNYANNPFVVYSKYESFLNPYVKNIKIALKKFLVADKYYGEIIQQELTDEQFFQLNQCCMTFDSKIKLLLDNKIEEYINALKSEKNSICLKKSDVIKEVVQIQRFLKEEDVIGYLFTNRAGEHYEPLIITHDKIVKPLSWYSTDEKYQIVPADFPGIEFYSTFPEEILTDYYPQPQADRISCRVLSFLYLKQLLKNNAEQFKESCLCFSYYDETETLRHVFLPSAQVMGYSQVSHYNQTILALLNDSSEKCVIKANKGDKCIEIRPIKLMLEHSINIAEKNSDHAIKNNNYTILNQLDSFRKKWLSDYKISLSKLQQMTIDGEKKYLIYCQYRMNRIAISEGMRASTLSIFAPKKLIYDEAIRDFTLTVHRYT